MAGVEHPARRESRERASGRLLLIWAVTAWGILAVVYSGYLFREPVERIAIGAALGGAASNMFDRVTRGAVLDFIDVGWWPVFNLADAAITCGVIAALLI